MAKLQLFLEGRQLAEYLINKERMMIGRRAGSDVHIDNMVVSSQHAAIVTIGNDSFLEDLGSTNGTKVNGKPIKKYVLNHGDQVEFGKYRLTYINETQPSLDSALTQIPDKVADLLHANGKTNGTASSSEPEIFGHLQVMTGEDAGKEILLNRAILTLGKQASQLAVLTKRPEGYFLTHVEGNNLPMVNNKAIGVQAYQLADQDVIDVGDVKMRFYRS